jgi:hypothetical protein
MQIPRFARDDNLVVSTANHSGGRLCHTFIGIRKNNPGPDGRDLVRDGLAPIVVTLLRRTQHLALGEEAQAILPIHASTVM